jgi:hypothetical protein
MKTTLKFLKPLLAVFTIMFFCNVVSAQSLAELVAMQEQLQNFIASGNAKINNPSATASMTSQQISDFQNEINVAQDKLNAINPMIAELFAVEFRAKQELMASQSQAAYADRKAEVAAQYAAEQAQIALKQQIAANPGRYASAPDPNHPDWMPFRVSTGNAEQDAQMVRDWLVQHGIVR